MVTESGDFVQTKLFKPCQNLKLRPHESGAITRPLCYPAFGKVWYRRCGEKILSTWDRAMVMRIQIIPWNFREVTLKEEDLLCFAGKLTFSPFLLRGYFAVLWKNIFKHHWREMTPIESNIPLSLCCRACWRRQRQTASCWWRRVGRGPRVLSSRTWCARTRRPRVHWLQPTTSARKSFRSLSLLYLLMCCANWKVCVLC